MTLFERIVVHAREPEGRDESKHEKAHSEMDQRVRSGRRDKRADLSSNEQSRDHETDQDHLNNCQCSMVGDRRERTCRKSQRTDQHAPTASDEGFPTHGSHIYQG